MEDDKKKKKGALDRLRDYFMGGEDDKYDRLQNSLDEETPRYDRAGNPIPPKKKKALESLRG